MYQEITNNELYKIKKTRTIDVRSRHRVALRDTTTPGTIMVLGFVHIGRTMKANSARLLPMYQADIRQGKAVPEKSRFISMNVLNRLSSVTTGLERLQAVVEQELR